MLHALIVVPRQLLARAHHDRLAAERRLHLGQRPDDLDLPRRARVRERDLGELARRVAEDADPRARRRQPPQRGVRVGTRTDPERRPVGREPRQQRPPVAERLVEHGRRRLPIRRARRARRAPAAPRPRATRPTAAACRRARRRGRARARVRPREAMLDSRHIPASGEGTPVQVRDGPAAVRGDALPPRRHWVAGPGRRRGREPRVRRPAARRKPEPLAEGGFVHRLAIAVVAALAAALVVVSLSAAAHQRTHVEAPLPHRIISLSPTVTEDLFAIGAGKQVVAVDQDSNYPQRAPRTSLSGYTPNVEAIANYHPDLVLISYNPDNFASQLRKLGIKVVIERGREQPQAGVRRDPPARPPHGPQPRREGRRALDADAPGGDRARACRSRAATCASTTSSTRRTTRPRRRRSSAASTSSSASRTSPTRRAATGGGYPQLSAEYIIAQNPQIIVLADTKCCGQNAATVAARPGWSTIAAVQHHRVVGVERRRRLALGAADRAVRAGGGADRRSRS